MTYIGLNLLEFGWNDDKEYIRLQNNKDTTKFLDRFQGHASFLKGISFSYQARLIQ